MALLPTLALLALAVADVDVAAPTPVVRLAGDATLEAPVTFRDGPHVRRCARLPDARDATWPEAARAAVRCTDPATGRAWRAFVDDTALVRTRDVAALEAHGVVVVRALLPAIGAWVVRDGLLGDGLDLAHRLQPLVERGQLAGAAPDLWLPHRTLGTSIPPDDPSYDGQWFLTRIGVEGAWALGTGDADTSILIVDDGCDTAHPDLRDKLDPGKDVIDGDDDPSYVPNEEGNAHGTSCAGLAGASTDNGVGIAGVCPDCRLRCVRMLGTGVTAVPVSADVDAVAFALDTDVDVSSNSWGYVEAQPAPETLRAAIEELFDHGRGGKGAVVVFAAGNDNRLLVDDELTNVRGVLTVGAVALNNEAAQYSSYGPSVDVVAPLGTLTLDIAGPDGADPGDVTESFNGTSSACPVAAGVAGLLAAAAPDLTSAEITDVIIATARPSRFGDPDERGHDDVYGFGLVQAEAAMASVLGVAGGGDGGPGDVPPPPTCACAGSSARAWPGWAAAAVVIAVRRRRR